MLMRQTYLIEKEQDQSPQNTRMVTIDKKNNYLLYITVEVIYKALLDFVDVESLSRNVWSIFN